MIVIYQNSTASTEIVESASVFSFLSSNMPGHPAEVGRRKQKYPWIRCYSYNTTDRRYTQVTALQYETRARLEGSKGANIRNRTDGDDLVRVRLLVIALLDVRKVARLGERRVVPVQLPQPTRKCAPRACQHTCTLVER